LNAGDILLFKLVSRFFNSNFNTKAVLPLPKLKIARTIDRKFMIGKKGMNLNRYPRFRILFAFPNDNAEKLRSPKTNDTSKQAICQAFKWAGYLF